MVHKIISFESRRADFKPARLTEAREFLELSMEDLAKLVGVTRQAISFYEQGARIPEPEILTKISHTLQQPLSYFTTERPPSLGRRGTIFFRSFKNKTKKNNKKCKILSSWTGQFAAYFDNFINMPPVHLPEIASPNKGHNYSDDEIENAAMHCRKFWKLNDGPIGDITGLVESKGIIVSHISLKNNIVDAFSFYEANRPFILLNQDKGSACRLRFDIAHELGHLLLHRGLDEYELETNLKEIEKEADKFASAFLLPRSTYPLEVYSTRPSAFVELKNRWKVSFAAQIFRCESLGLLSETQILNLRKHISAKKWRTVEPLDDKILLEKPKLLHKCLKMLLDNQIKQPNDIYIDMKLPKHVVEMFFPSLVENNKNNISDLMSIKYGDKAVM